MRIIILFLIVSVASCSSKWEVASSIGPEPRYISQLISIDNNLILFGGKNDTKDFNDLWSWNGSKWNLIGNGATKRWDHSYVYMKNFNQIFLFGGRAFEETEGKEERIELNDNWVYINNTWKQLKIESPEKRSAHTLVFNEKIGSVILFGGRNNEMVFNDTWSFNGKEWKKLNSLGPKGRFGHTLKYDKISENIYLFGGHDGKNLLNDLWVFDGVQWIEINSGVKPSPRMAHAMEFDNNGNAILFGGWDNKNSVSNELWLLKKKIWTQINTETKPQARLAHAIGFDQSNNEFIMFGGSSGFNGKFLSETWKFILKN
ncbi:kelch repeat-containing protein [Flagellimonas sp. S3867]|uniref:Kelch repeat-containing protein n=1 Tax=Flagellimonas sp. S3867 TaxID=2768063 RepID=UPI001682BF84|nr:kelch repeat-containing protein [Flagellimonas sp. S3867]